MTVTSGSTLGSYAILAPLGAGAMGEVWRARDTKLGREVAIKVLPEEFAGDEERLKRFEREAKTLASLNHPNVAQIFGVDQVDETCFLVLELVPGESLEERLRRGALSVGDALDACRQIAEGLEAAHEAGVIHRDLKPANVRLTPEGKVKVLDFGLAKPANEGGRGSSTDSVLSTEAGRLLGTPTYMAPEQARGKAIDKRVDIWAFGCVLYECLTARRAFEGETLTDVFAAVIEREPDLDKLPSSTPPRVRELLRRCFTKDPRARLRDVGEARVLLESPPEAVRREARGGWKLVAGAGAGLVLGALAGAYALRPLAAVPVPVSAPTAFRQVSDLPGQEREPSLSPDGKSVVYASKSAGNWDIFLQRVGGRTPINLTADSADDEFEPAFSPDGESIAFCSERDGGGVFVMGATGESVRRVADFGYAPAWSPDGEQLALATERVYDPLNRDGVSALWIVRLDGSEKRKLTEGDAVDASWSPDGKRIAFWGWREPDWQRDVFTILADGSESSGVLVTDDPPVDWSPVWTADGGGLYFGSNRGGTMNLWRVEVDPHSGGPAGPPVPVTTPSTWSGFFARSANGERLVYATRDEQTSVMTVGFDPEAGALVGEPERIFGGRALLELDWAPDGERLILTQRGDPWESMAIIRADGTGYSRITDASIQHRFPHWCPLEGSERIVIYSNSSVFSLRSDGSDPKAIGAGQRAGQAVWSSDGRSVLMMVLDERWLSTELQRFDIDPEGKASRAASPALSIEGRGIGGLADWSRDGARVLCTGQLPDNELYLVDLGSGESRKLTDYGGDPPAAHWLPNGRRALVRVSNQLFLLDVETLEQKPLLEAGSEAGRTWLGGHSLTLDGRKLAYIVPQGEGDVWLMDLADSRD